MTYFFDVDGTLTINQKKFSPVRKDMLDRVRQLIQDGDNVIIWSSTKRYADNFCKKNNLKPLLAVGKPQMIIDNQKKKWGNRLKNRTITPEEFLVYENKR